MIAAGTKIAQLGYSAEGSQAEDVVNLAQAEVYEMSTGRVKQDYEAIGPVVHDALEQLDKLQNGDLKGRADGFPRYRRRDPGPAARPRWWSWQGAPPWASRRWASISPVRPRCITI